MHTLAIEDIKRSCGIHINGYVDGADSRELGEEWEHSRYHGVGIEFASQGQSKNMCYFEPFIDTGIIGLDACTAYSGFCNCIVLEDNDL